MNRDQNRLPSHDSCNACTKAKSNCLGSLWIWLTSAIRRMSRSMATSLVSENPEHDYPKKIIYSINQKKQLEVRIIGKDDDVDILRLTKI